MRPSIGLRRVSTDKQAKGSDSPYVQDERIQATSIARERELITIYGSHVEGNSGGIAIAERKDALAAVEHAIRIKAELILDDLSRLGRIADDLEVHGKAMLRKGANIYCIAQNIDWEQLWKTAGGRFQIGIQCHLVQYTRDVTAELTTRTLVSRKQKNRRAGAIPYGWMIDPARTRTRKHGDTLEEYHSDLIENPAEQAILAEIKRLAANGWTAGKIARKLTEDGKPARSGRPWDPAVIWRLLNPGSRRK